MIDDLHRIGWKAFQDLCLAIAAEVLKRPIQSFLASKDGGRDGAFLGAWEGGEGVGAGKSTIQIKHFGNAGARLSLSHLAKELGKAKELAAQGLADDYIVITNAGVREPPRLVSARHSRRSACSAVACSEATGSRPSFGADPP